jgi:hypothetical protein
VAGELQEFYEELLQDIYRNADAEGEFVEDACFETLCEQLVEAGELETADRAFYQSPRGGRVDGYGGAPGPADGTLSLIISDFCQSTAVNSLTATDLDSLFRRLRTFLERALDPSFRNGLEESSSGFGLADLISGSWRQVKRVRLVVVSNRLLSARVQGRDPGELLGVPVTFSVWDLGRLHRYVMSGRAREDLVLDLDEYGGPLDALPAHLSDAGYEAYILVIPGSQLAKIYGEWGARLLEQNVRVFLQARGSVNKKIRITLENDPAMFFAYNNGITATAEEVVGDCRDGGFRITSIRNLQIVNGGQTTASIYAASQNPKVDLAKVFVQMKLSVIPSEEAERVVPLISEYANSQNKVNAADFFSNHPYHLRLKELSERIYVPSQDGSFRQSKWFYERARGQYQDARNKYAGSARAKFDLEYPKRQVLTKTDLAKVLGAWGGTPDVVSKGAQKNFAHFADYIGKAWASEADAFNDAYFNTVIAKTIAFRYMEKLVSSLPWYEGGYRANIVAYAIAKLAHDVEQQGKRVNFDTVWETQTIGPELDAALTVAANSVREAVTEPPSGEAQNVTEWAKQSACWVRVRGLKVSWPPELQGVLVSAQQENESHRRAKREQQVWNGIHAQSAVVKAGGEVWAQLREWGSERKLLSEKELDIFAIASRIPQRLPTEKQSAVLMKALMRLRDEGWVFGDQIGD